jgi:hypothetical protein
MKVIVSKRSGRTGSIRSRLDALGRMIPEKLPLTLEQTTRWFLMFCDKNGTGYATGKPDYTPDDWAWFEANEENFNISSKGYSK